MTSPDSDRVKPPVHNARQLDAVLAQVREALAGLSFGEISLTVQDGVVVQLERVERRRFRRGGS